MPRASSTTRPPARAAAPKPAVLKAQQELSEELAELVEVAEELAETIEELEEAQSETILIHFVKDGATAFGTVWYAGQEVEVDRSSDAFRSTLDRNGDSWLDKSEEDRLSRGPLTWKLGPSDIKNELIDYPSNFDPHSMTYHKGEWLDLTMLRQRAEREVARGRSIPKN